MKHKMPSYLILGILGGAFMNAAHAMSVPSFPISTLPNEGYPSFINKALTVDLTTKGSGANTYYQLTANGTGTFVFNLPTKQYSGTGGNYSLVANFDKAGNLISKIGTATLNNKVTIKGAVEKSEAGAKPAWAATAATTTLWSAKLSGFGFDTTKDVLGFKTDGASGWAKTFNPKNTAESVYLYDALGMNGYTGALAPLADAFKAKNLAPAAALAPITKVQSLTTVPIPLGFVLFGSAMAMLAGFRRKG